MNSVVRLPVGKQDGIVNPLQGICVYLLIFAKSNALIKFDMG